MTIISHCTSFSVDYTGWPLGKNHVSFLLTVLPSSSHVSWDVVADTRCKVQCVTASTQASREPDFCSTLSVKHGSPPRFWTTTATLPINLFQNSSGLSILCLIPPEVLSLIHCWKYTWASSMATCQKNKTNQHKGWIYTYWVNKWAVH